MLISFLELSSYPILADKGKVSALEAKLRAEGEYEFYRKKQDAEFISDFDRVVTETMRIEVYSQRGLGRNAQTNEGKALGGCERWKKREMRGTSPRACCRRRRIRRIGATEAAIPGWRWHGLIA